LAKLFDPAEVDWALGHAAVHGRFDLASILDHHARAHTGEHRRVGEDHSLTQGTSAWAGLGHPLEHTSPKSRTDDGDIVEGEVIA